MECKACGYKWEEDIIDGELKVIEGDELFKKIEGSFHYEDNSGYHDQIFKVNLYLCPKCGNVVGEVD